MIVVFSGQIASGKSTLAKQLAEWTGWKRYSFGNYVAACADQIGLNSKDRKTLQDLGACLSKHPECFIRGFVNWTGMPENMILDGLRHKSVLDELRRQVGDQSLKLIFVDTPAALSQHRFDGNLTEFRKHEVEADIEQLKSFADWVLPDSSTPSFRVVTNGFARISQQISALDEPVTQQIKLVLSGPSRESGTEPS